MTKKTNTNDWRAHTAGEAIRAFRVWTKTDDCDALADLLCNLKHYCDRKNGANGWDFEDALARARRQYAEEVTEDCARLLTSWRDEEETSP
jgi:hypothetical protein